MEKGKLGIRFSFYAVIAFILAFLGYSTILFLLAGVVLIAEKNEWAFRQIIQAICLCIVSGVINSVLGILDFMYEIPFIGSVWNVLTSVMTGIISIVVLVCCIIAILNTAKGKEANIPLASKFADWACGIVAAKAPQYQQAQPFQQMPQQNVQPQPFQQTPQQNVQPQQFQQTPQQNVQPQQFQQQTDIQPNSDAQPQNAQPDPDAQPQNAQPDSNTQPQQ